MVEGELKLLSKNRVSKAIYMVLRQNRQTLRDFGAFIRFPSWRTEISQLEVAAQAFSLIFFCKCAASSANFRETPAWVELQHQFFDRSIHWAILTLLQSNYWLKWVNKMKEKQTLINFLIAALIEFERFSSQIISNIEGCFRKNSQSI